MKNQVFLISLIFTLLICSNKGLAQAPDLGGASNFALFTKAGAFGSLGSTYITGNIGTDLGAFTGFPPGVVDGEIHVVDSTSLNAAKDVDTAYNYLTGVACDTAIGTILGNNQILTPKTYCLGGAPSTLDGDLILDAQGDLNALFIFKIDGALSASAHTNIVLINSASLYNVYWQINGVFDLGDSSVFRGIIVSNGAINLWEGSSLLGRGLSRAGAISLHNNRVDAGTQTSLPVKLVSFNIEKNKLNNSVNLSWQTASESNSAYFLIERSSDGINFKSIGKVNTEANSSVLRSYFFTDEYPEAAVNYYRLKQFDLNGTHEYFPAKSIQLSTVDPSVNIYPNPFTTTIKIFLNNKVYNDKIVLKIYNAQGVETNSANITEQLSTVEITGLRGGIYFYKLFNNNTPVQSGSLISQ